MDKTVLCYLEKNDCYLMLYRNKKEHDLNEGKWIGIGGHIEQGETKEEALIREIKEETNLDLKSFKYYGEIIFVNDDYSEVMYLYTSNDFTGDMKPCDEGELRWIKKSEILNLNLWEGDRIFLPMLMSGKDNIKLKLVYSGKILKNVENSGDLL